MLFGVRGRVWLLFAALLGGLEGPTRLCHGRYSGFQGCKFSSSVCRPDESCVDDRLFGNCQKINRPRDRFQYYLDKGTLQALEGEIYRLIKGGYSWESLYTQCVLGNILVAFRQGIPHDDGWCDKQGSHFVQSSQSKLDDASLNQLEKYLAEYYLSDPTVSDNDKSKDLAFLDAGSREIEPASYLDKKAEEFLKIHKYVPSDDKRMAPLPSAGATGSDTGAQDYSYDYDAGNYDNQDYYQRLLNGFSTNDLQALKDYLQDEDQAVAPDYTDYSVDLKDADMDVAGGGYVWSSEQPLTDAGLDLLVQNKQSQDSQKNLMKKPANTDLPIADKMTDKSSPEYDKKLAMTPDDAKLLGDLLEDNIAVTSLSDEQIRRLNQHVEKMLTAMQRDGRHDNTVTKQQAAMVDAVEKTVKEGISKGDLKPQGEKKAVTKEQLNTVLLRNLGAHNDAKISVKKANVPENSQIKVQEGDSAVVTESVSTETSHYKEINTQYANIQLAVPLSDMEEAQMIIRKLEQHMHLPEASFTNVRYEGPFITFRVDVFNRTAAQIAKRIENNKSEFGKVLGVLIKSAGIGDKAKIAVSEQDVNSPKYFLLTFVLCGCIAGIVISVISIYLIKRHLRSRKKLEKLAATGESSQVTQDYQDLCRQRMQSKASEKPEPLSAASRVGSTSESAVRSPSSRSSTSSWSEEPANSNMDISTGHIVLSYMEDHLKNKDRLDREWDSLCAYEAEPCATKVGNDAKNMRKNRYSDIVPYDHSRVVLSVTYNVSASDYVNASSITDHDPRNPAYIATQGPLPHTVADFWQMVWEQGSVVIVDLTKLTENGVAMCHRYWPEEGSDLYHIYEVHLVSEHIWCDDYLVRSFYLKNLQTNETRTVTQFHFLSWPDLGVPASIKALLDFRRKVNKSYRGRSCPIVLHCSDGVGRSGTYCLVDMVLNRMSKGAKEIDIAATLEHIRDQRMSMVKTKEQFEFALAAVAEEVHAILKALPQ